MVNTDLTVSTGWAVTHVWLTSWCTGSSPFRAVVSDPAFFTGTLLIVVPVSMWYAVATVRCLWAVTAVAFVVTGSAVGITSLTGPVWVTDTVAVFVKMGVRNARSTVTRIWSGTSTEALDVTVSIAISTVVVTGISVIMWVVSTVVIII